jgi:hypothetical protein
MDVVEGTRLTRREYVALCRDDRLNIRSAFHPPTLPVYNASVTGKESGELLAYLWFSPAREEWIMFSPLEASEEAEALFS